MNIEEINIVLGDSDHAREFYVADGNNKSNETNAVNGSLVHQNEFNSVYKIIGSSIPSNEKEGDKENLHNTITISGTRGSGKTSFLLSINKAIANDREFPNIKGGNSKPSDLQILEIVDPTLIEEKGHVFLNVISIITDLIEDKLDSNECNPIDKDNQYKRKEWRASLTALAGGLPSIGGIGNNNTDGWQDPEFVMDTGLKLVISSRKLARNFNRFLKNSLGILGKKAFLLMFDDIDVDSTKGWSVLETIRKYFTGARLITILSGDLKLYSKVIRQKKWANFGEEIIKYEGKWQGRLTSFNNMVTELESQYLQKIMQSRYRIHLPTLQEKVKDNSRVTKIYVYQQFDEIVDNSKTKTEIVDFYKGILIFFGVSNPFQSEAYYSFLLRQPLRTQIQFMYLFEDVEGYAFKQGQSMRLTDIFLSDLIEKDIDYSLITRSTTYLISEILQFLIREDRLSDLYQLQPTTTDNSLNACLCTLSFLLSQDIKKGNSFLIFDYLIKIGYVRNLIPLFESNPNLQNKLTIQQLCNKSNLYNDGVLRDQVGHLISYVRAFVDFTTILKSEFKLRAGTIPIYGEGSKLKQKIDVLSGRIDIALKGANKLQKTLVYIPLSANHYNRNNSSLLTYSIYLLLATIGEIAKRSSLGDNMPSDIIELSQLRSFVMPDFKGANDDGSENFKEEKRTFKEDESDEEISSDNLFFIELSRWISKGNNLSISPHLLGKIATRFSYALSNIESSYDGKRSLGDVFHSQIVALMNAILIEDVRENTLDIKNLNLGNTRYSDNLLINNIKKQLFFDGNKIDIKNKEDLFFSRWLLSCPLLTCYLNIDKQEKTKVAIQVKDIKVLKEALSFYCNDNNAIFSKYLVYDLLCKVEIRNDDSENRKDAKSVGKLSLGSTRQYKDIIKLLEGNIALEEFDKTGLSIQQKKQRNLKITKVLKELGIDKVTTNYINQFSEYLKNNV